MNMDRLIDDIGTSSLYQNPPEDVEALVNCYTEQHAVICA